MPNPDKDMLFPVHVWLRIGLISWDWDLQFFDHGGQDSFDAAHLLMDRARADLKEVGDLVHRHTALQDQNRDTFIRAAELA